MDFLSWSTYTVHACWGRGREYRQCVDSKSTPTYAVFLRYRPTGFRYRFCIRLVLFRWSPSCRIHITLVKGLGEYLSYGLWGNKQVISVSDFPHQERGIINDLYPLLSDAYFVCQSILY